MREKENLTLLGNQQTEYRMDYDPSVLRHFRINILKTITSSSSTARNSQVCARSPDSQILQRSRFPMFRTNVLWRVNP